MSEERKKVNITRLRTRDIKVPANILLVGPSVSRKNDAILRLTERIEYELGRAHRNPEIKTLIVTSNPDMYDHIGRHTLLLNEEDSLDDRDLNRSNICIFENLKKPDFSLFDRKRRRTTIIAIPDYNISLPRSAIYSIDYVCFFGGIDKRSESLVRFWKDFNGENNIQLKDFIEIYLACTNESDRYSDSFMVVKPHHLWEKNQTATADIEDILSKTFQWSTLKRDAMKDITVEISTELVLNTVQSIEEVKIEPPPQSQAQTEEIQVIEDEKETAMSELPVVEREPRDDCCIL